MELEVISYDRLRRFDAKETLKLVRVCQSEGIFFLDVKNGNSATALQDMSTIIAAQRKFFGQNEKHKMEFAHDSPSKGYDCFDELCVQRLKMSREQQLQGQLRLPPDLRGEEERISRLFSFNDTVLRDVASLLCSSVDPKVNVDISDPQNPGPSNMCLGIASAPAGTAILGCHLDEDVLTMTYYDKPFLEVRERSTGEWKLVDVCEDMPIVNVGEELQKASENRFYAPSHRVVQSPGDIDLVMYDLNEGGRV